jgi:hypothetical protein
MRPRRSASMNVRGMSMLETSWPQIRDANVDQEYATSWIELMDLYEQNCVELEFTASAATIGKIKSVIAQPNPLPAEINPLIIELAGRLHDEMYEK